LRTVFSILSDDFDNKVLQRRLAATPIPKEADDKAGFVTPGLNDISEGLGEAAAIKPVLLTEFDGKIS
jgi:hypothetical protein